MAISGNEGYAILQNIKHVDYAFLIHRDGTGRSAMHFL